MFNFIAVMFAGLLVGYLLRSFAPLQRLGGPITYTIWALLFLMGVSVGSNRTISENWSTLGGLALALTLSGTALSVLLGWLVWRIFFRKRGRV